MVPSTVVLLLGGSIREHSYTQSLVRAIAERLETAEGADAHIWNLRNSPLPIADPEYHENPDAHPDSIVRAFAQLASSADAIVLATPIYHNGISGVMKNALDHLTIQHFFLKPVGLASHGEARTTQAVEQLRIVVRGLLGYAITTQVCTSEEDYTCAEMNEAPVLAAASLIDRVSRFCRELAVMAQLMAYARQLLA